VKVKLKHMSSVSPNGNDLGPSRRFKMGGAKFTISPRGGGIYKTKSPASSASKWKITLVFLILLGLIWLTFYLVQFVRAWLLTKTTKFCIPHPFPNKAKQCLQFSPSPCFPQHIPLVGTGYLPQGEKNDMTVIQLINLRATMRSFYPLLSTKAPF